MATRPRHLLLIHRDAQIVAHFLPHFGARRLDEITKSDIVRYLNLRRTQMTGNPGHKNRRLISESTVRRERGLLQSIFERAVDEGDDIRNPSRGIKRGKDKPRTRVLTLDEERLLLEALHGAQPEGPARRGKLALDWHGVRHNVVQQPTLQLYGWASSPLPAWFTERFPSAYHRLRLFDEKPDALLRVSRFQHKPDGPLVSDPERAVVELLSDVGVRQPLQEARDLLEGTPSLRVAVLQELLARCKQVKADSA